MTQRATVKRPKAIPGVEIRERTHRTGATYFTFRVRYRDHRGERRSREFDTPSDAIDFKANLRLLERRGELASLDAGRELLSDFMPEWWRLYAKPRLSVNTRRKYRSFWNAHILPRLGPLELRQLTPLTLSQFLAELEEDGVGQSVARSSMSMLQRMLGHAVEWGHVPANAAKSVTKPPARRERAVIPVAPATVERLRARLRTASDAHGHRDATMVSLLAYAGVRPEELLAVEARHVRRSTLLIEQKVVHGELLVGQKTGRPPRTVKLLGPLLQDVREYMIAERIRDGLLFGRADGEPWQDHDYRNWRKRVYKPQALKVAIASPRPYDLRHSFASLLIHEGELSIAEIADQLGHSIDTLLRHYTHLIAEFKDQPKRSAEAAIRAARKRSARPQDAPRKRRRDVG